MGGPLTIAESNFCRKRFYYEIGQDFSQFVRKFNAQAFLFNPRALVYNSMLYEALNGVAATMGDPYDPTLPEYRDLTKAEYVELLRGVFEPASQTEIAINEFNERKQLSHEYVGLYFHSKLQLFHRAYTPAQRNYSLLYKKTINGLINKQMRFVMAQFRPEPIENHVAFANELGRQVTIIREHLDRGDIDEAAAAGTVSYKTTQLHFSQTQGTGPKIKDEPINAVRGGRTGKSESEGNGRDGLEEGIMAMRGGQPKKCFYCGEEGHFIAQCPRKLAGMPGAVSSVEAEHEADQEEPAEAVNYTARRFTQKGNYASAWRGRPYNQQYQQYQQYKSGSGYRGKNRGRGRGKNYNGGRLFLMGTDELGYDYQEEVSPEEVAEWLSQQQDEEQAEVNQLENRVAGLSVAEKAPPAGKPSQGIPPFFLGDSL